MSELASLLHQQKLGKVQQSAKETNKAYQRQINDLEKELETVKVQLDRAQTTRAVRLPKAKAPTRRSRGDIVRVCIPDTHGAKVDKAALAAVMSDVKALAPHEVILLGDHVDCGGFLAQHHTMGYVAETTYSYEDDIDAANAMLNQLAEVAPGAKMEYLAGNHEDRIERWAVTETLRNSKDAEGLRRLYSPEFRLKLAERGIPYRRTSEFYDGLSVPGVIKRGKCYFFHGITTAKHAVAVTQSRIGGNCVSAHTHRAQSDITRTVGAGVIGSWNPGCLCYDAGTEVLTDRGFVMFPELLPTDRVAEFDPWTRSIVYRVPVAHQRYAFKGDMIKFESPRIDLLVTPEHKMLLTKDKNMYTRTAGEVVNMPGSSFKVPLAGVFVGENTGITVDEGRLAGWVVAEGSLDTSSYGYRVTIYQKKQPYRNQINMLLRRLGIKFTSRVDARTGVTGFRICADDSRALVSKLFDGGNIKRISRTILRSSQPVLRGFYESAMRGDGSRTGLGTGVYATISRLLADDFQELCHKIGYACTVRLKKMSTNLKKDAEIYLCGVRKFSDGDLFNVKSPKREHCQAYDGEVFDITTTTGYFMVRRNGKVCVSGNCDMQPLWQHGAPTNWTHGYAVQLISPGGAFLHLNIPVLDGKTNLTALFNL